MTAQNPCLEQYEAQVIMMRNLGGAQRLWRQSRNGKHEHTYCKHCNLGSALCFTGVPEACGDWPFRAKRIQGTEEGSVKRV